MLTRWVIPRLEPGEAERLASALDVSLPAARVLAGRGLLDAEAARRFLRSSLTDLHDPFLMLGMREALERLRRAIARSEKILLYGDYDVDGTTSVVIVKKAIELAGGRVSFHIPDRLKDGYGMRTEAIDQAAADGVNLIISLDTGIRAAEAVCRARSLGIDVIVTDHHLPDTELPPAYAVLNPKQPGCSYPDKNLCGAGVALKLVEALLRSLDWGEDKCRRMIESFLKVVAIATVADVVPLTGENRIIVKHGLAGFRSVRNHGLRALLRVSGMSEGEVPTASQVAFRLAPRLNAAGRMAHANDIVSLLLTEDEQEAGALADKLHALNRERQDAQAGIVHAILDDCLKTPITDDQAALVFAGPEWHRGIVGIVASRLVERFHRPVFVLAEDPEQGVAQGSGRSIPAFHLLDALESMQHLLLRFGGHRQAAGLTIALDRVDEFRAALAAYAAERLTPADFVPEVAIDTPLELRELNERAVADVMAIEPFGYGNARPLFGVMGAEVAGTPAVWKDKHLMVSLRQNGRTLTVKGWQFAERAAELAPGARVDAALCLERDDYGLARGYPGWCAVLKDVRPAGGTE
ncbi:MAG TPA: single-stranded-DNA-specific exonuclease RecJ [Bryobacteraceae bacterium]|nr:single-stranded-DNA-specific exonuclease RecJ [Bryobacteraceae bacterium]